MCPNTECSHINVNDRGVREFKCEACGNSYHHDQVGAHGNLVCGYVDFAEKVEWMRECEQTLGTEREDARLACVQLLGLEAPQDVG